MCVFLVPSPRQLEHPAVLIPTRRSAVGECFDEDEIFECEDGTLLPLDFAFDGVADCLDGSDESEVASSIFSHGRTED
jgi:hypothetical protein